MDPQHDTWQNIKNLILPKNRDEQGNHLNQGRHFSQGSMARAIGRVGVSDW